MSKEPLNIVILGGSYAGLSAAHNFLKTTIEELGVTRTAPKYRVVLVSPSTHLFWNIGAPRAIVSPALVPHSKTFIPLLEAFREYPTNRFSFVHGSALSVDFVQKHVTIGVIGKVISPILSSNRWSNVSATSKDGNHETSHMVPYHALILATGTSTDSPLLSLHGPHQKTMKALDTFHARLRDASSIIIAGGGPSGVECAGQLATFLNARKLEEKMSKPRKSTTSARSPKMEEQNPREKILAFLKLRRKRPVSAAIDPTSTNHKTIILISGNDRLLTRLPPAIGENAEKKLKKLGVNLIHSLRLISAQELPSGSTRCVLSDELSMSCDLFIAATGVYPNTQFLPSELLDASGYVSTDPRYLRVDRAGDRVYAIGDCSCHSKNTITDVYDSIPVLLRNLKNDLLSFELKTQYPFGGAEEQLDKLEDLEYVQDPTTTQLIPITRFGGVGVLFDHILPSLLVWWMKGRNYRFNKTKLVAKAGHNPYAPDTYIYR